MRRNLRRLLGRRRRVDFPRGLRAGEGGDAASGEVLIERGVVHAGRDDSGGSAGRNGETARCIDDGGVHERSDDGRVREQAGGEHVPAVLRDVDRRDGHLRVRAENGLFVALCASLHVGNRHHAARGGSRRVRSLAGGRRVREQRANGRDEAGSGGKRGRL